MNVGSSGSAGVEQVEWDVVVIGDAQGSVSNRAAQ